MSKWVSLEAVCEHLDVSERFVRKLVAKRAIPYAQPGGSGSRLLFNLDEIDAFLAKGTAPKSRIAEPPKPGSKKQKPDLSLCRIEAR